VSSTGGAEEAFEHCPLAGPGVHKDLAGDLPAGAAQCQGDGHDVVRRPITGRNSGIRSIREASNRPTSTMATLARAGGARLFLALLACLLGVANAGAVGGLPARVRAELAPEARS
jgi:hypothetical protein